MTTINDNHILKDGGYSNYESTLNLPRHRWYYYKEGFSPLLVEKAFEESKLKDDDLVIDPFNGSGTTTLTAAANNFKSYGIEVNPFTAFLSKTKTVSVDVSEIDKIKSNLLQAAEKSHTSDLLGFSTFSKSPGLDKWLFNDDILNAFEGGWQFLNNISSYNLRKLIKLSLISSTMQNCNARRDGKCLRYKTSWKETKFDKYSFLECLSKNLDIIKDDISTTKVRTDAIIKQGDARQILRVADDLKPFKLCVTSPPYLNTFDYTDIYRPELFLGKFLSTREQLYNLRLTTVRSHIQAKWEIPKLKDFGLLYEQTMRHLLDHSVELMHKNIPVMVQAYFEDMLNILKLLRAKANKDAQLWLVVSNSAYADLEVPVDLIIGELGANSGWYLKEIVVLRYINRRKTSYSKTINQLRESVIIFSANKR